MTANKVPPILDGHNGTLLVLPGAYGIEPHSFFERSEHGHLDLPRAIEANLAGGMFAIFPGIDQDDGDELTFEALYNQPVALGSAQQATFSGQST